MGIYSSPQHQVPTHAPIARQLLPAGLVCSYRCNSVSGNSIGAAIRPRETWTGLGNLNIRQCKQVRRLVTGYECPTIGAEIATLRQGVDALIAVHEEFDRAIPEVASGAHSTHIRLIGLSSVSMPELPKEMLAERADC